jgi:hypothetical protein
MLYSKGVTGTEHQHALRLLTSFYLYWRPVNLSKCEHTFGFTHLEFKGVET